LERQQIEDNVGPYLTVSREHGAGGSEIARRVGELLGWDVLDGELLDCMAEQYGTPRSLLEFVDETQLGWMTSLFNSWAGKQRLTQEAYVHRISQLMLLAAHHGNVIVVGRGGRFILPRDRGLSIRILAPLEFRAEQVMLQRGISMSDARTLIKKVDKERQAFKAKYFHHNAADPHEYDLVINVEKLDQENTAKLVASAVRSWLEASGIRSPVIHGA
jgi:cytidylate kinase